MIIFVVTEEILKKPCQFLELGDEGSRIMVRPLAPQVVCFHSDQGLNTRLVRKSLKDFDIVSCEQMGESQFDVLVVFKETEG